MAGGLPQSAKVIMDIAEKLSLQDSKPQPLITGKILLSLGFSPGPEMGRILKEMFEYQLDGRFHSIEEGLAILGEKKC